MIIVRFVVHKHSNFQTISSYNSSACSTVTSGVAKPRPTQALAQASAHLALTSEIDDDHMINLYSLQPVVQLHWGTSPTIISLWPYQHSVAPPSVFQVITWSRISMIWLLIALQVIKIADISANKNISVSYFHKLTHVNFKHVMYFNMAGSEVLKCDCEVTEVID